MMYATVMLHIFARKAYLKAFYTRLQRDYEADFLRVIQREHQNLFLEKRFYGINPTLKWRIWAILVTFLISRWLLLMMTTISLKQNDLNLSFRVDLLILKFLTLLDPNFNFQALYHWCQDSSWYLLSIGKYLAACPNIFNVVHLVIVSLSAPRSIHFTVVFHT